jgi:hypothetical protein
MVIRRQFGGKPAAHASAIHNKVVFPILVFHFSVNKLHILQHFLFTSFSRAFSKTTVIHEQYIIVVAVKITGITGPTLNAPGVAMKIKDQSFWIFPEEMKSIDTYSWFDIEKIFPEGDIVFELEILF